MKTYRLITLNPLKLVTKSVSGKPTSMQVKDGYPAPTPPWWPENFDAKYAYVEELAYPEETPAEGFVWIRELTTETYGWAQTAAPPAPNPEWYVQPAWRVRAVAKATPLGAGTVLDAVTVAIAGITDPLQQIVAEEVFFGGNILERDSTLLVGMAAGLGLTDEQLDDLFKQAHAIEV
jgi:hypothetical protein